MLAMTFMSPCIAPAAAGDGGEQVFLTNFPREAILLAFVVLAALMWLMYRGTSSKLSKPRRYILIGLRVVFVAIAIFLLAIPAIQKPRHRETDVFTAVLVDTSRSMSLADVDASGQAKLSRLDAARQILGGATTQPGQPAAGLLAELRKNSRVVVYAFDQGARRVENLSTIRPDGALTNFYRSLHDLDGDLRGLPLAGVVMLTDGARNTGGSMDEAAKLFKDRAPLHVIGLGNPTPPRDYEVVKIESPRRVRRNSEVEVFATVRSTGYKTPFDVQVFRGSTLLATCRVQPIEGSDLQRVRLAFTPDQEGAATYTVSIPPAADEAVKTNNSRDFSMEVRDDRLPVLYIEGSPRSEYRYLRRAMSRDSDFRLVGMLRLAKDRFYTQGANDTEQYLQKGFPDTPERLFAFQAVILGDIEASYFTPKQLDLLEEFARVRGGGVLMLGGVNSFGLGQYAQTPVAKVLPLDITTADGSYRDDRFTAQITAEGLKHPVMRLSQDVAANQRLWASMPPLIGITPVHGVKAGGQVLLTAEKDASPVLAVQNYGQGRVAAFTSGGSWYWQMSVPVTEEFHEKFWKQLIRWLVVGAREQLTVETDREMYPRREPVNIQATVCGKDLAPLNDAVVTATVTDPLGNKQELALDWVLSQEGVYQCRYVPQDEGNYEISVAVQGWTSKHVQAEFRVTEPMDEFNDAGLKKDSLKSLAAATGGRYYNVDETMQVPGEIEKGASEIKNAGVAPEVTPIWDSPIWFGLLIVVGAAEWYLRRRFGLA